MRKQILIIIITVIVLTMIALMTSDWSTSDGIGINKLSFGLWKNCVDKSCGNIERIYNSDFPKTSLYLCRALIIISLLCLLLALYSEYSNNVKNTNMLILVSGILLVLTCIIWAIEFRKLTISGSGSIPNSEIKYTLNYSFYFNLLAGLICVAFASYNYKW